MAKLTGSNWPEAIMLALMAAMPAGLILGMVIAAGVVAWRWMHSPDSNLAAFGFNRPRVE